MQEEFAEAWVNRDDHEVLGRRLHDYCLYHALALNLSGNPICNGAPATLPDLREAVLICSTPPDQFLRARRLMSTPALRWWQFKSRKLITEIEFKKFRAYIEDFDSRPVFWEEDEKPDSEGGLSAPWILSMAAFIESHSNMTEHEIMSAPIGKMFWKSAALAEMHGMSKAKMMTAEESAAIAEMAAMPDEPVTEE